MAAPNPNTARITDALWRCWTDVQEKLPGVRLSGIYANKSGYHNTVTANTQNWPGNYSIRLPLDVTKPADKARAIDYTLSDELMILVTKRLRDSALDPTDDRLEGLREFYGTLDGKTVYGLIKDTEKGPWRRSTSDLTHLWHVHGSFFTASVALWAKLSGWVSVVIGQTYAQWKRGGDDVIGLKQRKTEAALKLPATEEEKALQVLVRNAGGDVGGIDGKFGAATEKALTAVRRSVGSGETSTPEVTGWAFGQLLTALARKQGGGEPGKPGEPGPPPSAAQLAQAISTWVQGHASEIIGAAQVQQFVNQWMEAHKEELRGPAGKTPTKVQITGVGEVTEVV